ncbi:MAG TPA: hypothetical protein VFZ34_07290 [Blastocatellia bacterium]|nr:hypothetical protein [Blastocatellia bacterium]
MMQRTILIALLLCCPFTTFAQSPDKILKQAVKALGGEKNLKRITSTQMSGKLTRKSDNASGSYQTFASKPDLYTVTVDIGGFAVSEGYNGKSGWRRDSRAGLRTLTGQDGTDFRTETIYRNARWFDAKKDKSKLTTEGTANINGKPANVVILTTVKGVKIKIYFDTASGLLVKEDFPAGALTKSYEYSDFRAVDGVMEPFAIALTMGDETFAIQLDEVAHNKPVDRARFDFLKISNEPLPDVAALLEAVKNNQSEIDRIRENYGYTRVTTERMLDDKGKLQDKETNTYDVSFYRGRRLSKLVEKNGKPLTPEEEKKHLKQLEDIIKRINKQEDEKAKKKAQADAKRKGEEEADEDNSDNRGSITEILQCSKLLNPRRELFRQREMIVFDFEPAPTCNPKTSTGKMAQKLKLIGAFWIDPNDKQIARLEMRLGDSFKVAGGLLASIKSGSAIVFEQERVNNEIWLPTYEEFNIALKVLLFKGINANGVTRFRDYKKFNVEAEKEKLKLPVKP